MASTPATRRSFLPLLCVPALAAQNDGDPSPAQATFRSTTSLVLLEVSVLDRVGVPIPGLTADRFRIAEAGRPQPVTQFSTGAESLSVALVVDYSRSMRPRQPAVMQGVSRLAAMLEPADELSVTLFNENVSRAQDWSPASLGSPDLAARTPDGMTALYDAILFARNLCETARHPRRVIIVISDGHDTASHAAQPEVVQAIEESNLIVYAIGLFPPHEPRRGAGALRNFAEAAGGQAVFDPDPAALTSFLERVVADLRTRYVIGFRASAPAPGSVERRDIRVTVPGIPGVRVRSRRHYRIRGGE